MTQPSDDAGHGAQVATHNRSAEVEQRSAGLHGAALVETATPLLAQK